ncbi:M48 family metalloprotease [Streptomyces shenzhenensis]|uniref:M48 family metalloprotease n=1 Tax=Streptomyces shenzhenensis TaxID=943815 RepID=UPI003800CDD1
MLGLPGRVVVSSGMLRLLTPREWQALFAHERAHPRNRRHLCTLVLHLAATVNSLLRPVERAIARAALAASQARKGPLAATGRPVPQRVQALLAPPAPHRNGAMAAFAFLMGACCASLALTARDTERLCGAAMHAHVAGANLRAR